jgi:hypothetical protein
LLGKLNGLNLVFHKADSEIQLTVCFNDGKLGHLGQSYRIEFKLSQVFVSSNQEGQSVSTIAET